MGFHNNRLREINVFDQSEAEPSEPKYASRTSNEDFITQEATPEKKRKRKESFKIQTLHSQPAVDSARAADMDHIHFGEPFEGFNFTSFSADNQLPHHYGNGVFLPWMQAPSHANAFYNDEMPSSSNLAQSLTDDTLMPDSSVQGSFVVPEAIYDGDTDLFSSASFAPGAVNAEVDGRLEADFRHEAFQDLYTVSVTPAEESDFVVSESEEERPCKTVKFNKDGAPRKPRQPRPKLLKWSDDDWKNVCLGIVWACGETGAQIPFEQAAQVVGEKCTAGALQQALLKLRGKQIAEGYQIPNLKMAWTRKNKQSASGGNKRGSAEGEANKPRKKPTRMEATQSLLVTLPRPYRSRDRQDIPSPYKWKKPSRKTRSSIVPSSVDVKQEGPSVVRQHDLAALSYTHPGTLSNGNDYLPTTPPNSQGLEYLPITPMSGPRLYSSSPTNPFDQNTSHIQGRVISDEQFANLLTTEGLHDFGHSFTDANSDVFMA